MSTIRVLVTSKVSLTQEFYSDGMLANTDGGNVTVTVKRKADGVTVQSGNATNASTGVYTFSLSPSSTLDHWTVDWSGLFAGATVVQRDYVEHVGGFLFGLREAINRQGISTDRFSINDLSRFRSYVEQTCEEICRRAFVPRYAFEILPGSGSSYLRITHTELRSLRSVTIGNATPWTVDERATVQLRPYGSLVRPGALWPSPSLIGVEYEHGWDGPPEAIRQAAMTHLRAVLAEPRTAIPDRATSYSGADGSAYRLAMPGEDSTGIPSVDAVYQRYRYGRSAVFA